MDRLQIPKPEFRKKHVNWYQAMVIILAAFLFATFLQTLSSGATIEGYSVIGEPIPDDHSFSGTTALLVVIFAFFGLFIIIVTRKLDYRSNP
ncbi:TPA: hypothetical protein HA265_00725 [Candidatus Woesearchaeota archaeon]|nr:hypothetical protein [Candidatus Woesearchaeota archaeon]